MNSLGFRRYLYIGLSKTSGHNFFFYLSHENSLWIKRVFFSFVLALKNFRGIRLFIYWFFFRGKMFFEFIIQKSLIFEICIWKPLSSNDRIRLSVPNFVPRQIKMDSNAIWVIFSSSFGEVRNLNVIVMVSWSLEL